MKIRLKFKNDEESNLLLKDEYMVIAIHGYSLESCSYGIFNDELVGTWVGSSAVEVIDEDRSELIQKGAYYIHKRLDELLPHSGGTLFLYGYRFCSKVYRFFEEYHYEIPESYRNTLLNEQYKMNLIDGYLMAVNHYMMVKFEGGCYYENFRFYKGESIDKIVLKEDDHMEEFNIGSSDGYKSVLFRFIEKTLYDKEPGEEKSKYLCQSLLSLIEALFIYDIDKMYTYQSFYDDCLIIKYQNEYYYLNKFWFG